VFRAQADWTLIVPSATSCERAAPLAEKNAAARHRVLRSLISLHNEHRVYKEEVLRFFICAYYLWEMALNVVLVSFVNMYGWNGIRWGGARETEYTNACVRNDKYFPLNSHGCDASLHT
jgi:hypothetical protein